MTFILTSKRSLFHAYGVKKAMSTVMAFETSNQVIPFLPVESSVSTFRASKLDRSIQPWHLPPPVYELGCYSNIRECRIKPCEGVMFCSFSMSSLLNQFFWLLGYLLYFRIFKLFITIRCHIRYISRTLQHLSMVCGRI